MPQTPELHKTIPSDWSDFFPLYDEAVATAPRGSILIECGTFASTQRRIVHPTVLL